MSDISFKTHINSLNLPVGEGSLIGVDAEGHAYIEILHEDEWLLRYAINPAGHIIANTDERESETLLTIPDDCKMPRTHPALTHLNWNRGRTRGIRAQESAQERVEPLHLQQKMALISTLNLTISPMMLFGVDESYVLSSILLDEHTHLLCRRLRLIYALPTIRYDDYGLPYDYDSILLYCLQTYDVHTDEIMPDEITSHLLDIPLTRPMDCVRWRDNLYIFDAGDTVIPPQLHLWMLA